MKKKKSERGVEQIFPNAKGRAAADASTDKLDPKLPMTSFLDAWEDAYFKVVGSSPFREKKKS